MRQRSNGERQKQIQKIPEWKIRMHIQIHIGFESIQIHTRSLARARTYEENLIKIFHLRTHNLIETCRLLSFHFETTVYG